MNITGIITEYNPLHKGHLHHIKKTKEVTNCDAIICIMSGNYVQRGIPAIIDKWTRTKMALLSGVDLVIELPVVYSLSSAEFFSFGAISLLNNLGSVNNLCFGSEVGNSKLLFKIAEILYREPEIYKDSLRRYLKSGLPFHGARSLALKEYISALDTSDDFNDIDSILSTSNNILGIEYCKSLIKLNSSITPYSIKREGANYNNSELSDIFSSATAIRKHLRNSKNILTLKEHLPESTYYLIQNLLDTGYNFTYDEYMYPYIKYKSYERGFDISNIPDVSEGLDNKIRKALSQSNSLHNAIELTKSKRYTYTRISRILCQYYIGFEKYDTGILRTDKASYGRILGFNETGAKVLHQMKKNADIPMYTKIPRQKNEHMSLDIISTQKYSIINNLVNYNDDFLVGPIIIK
jgi:predicted nucleotidyltransferase